jgi:hypothetical protein
MLYTAIRSQFEPGEPFMPHQITITLTNAEYKVFSAEAAKRGTKLETFLHEVLA